ncbi:Oidioi.mRNA.OKI2018_I69.PAR.g10885.t1.cds [Oikopleura dioica]|uniref:Mitochondrial cardiolipin hydrolase n=1 Tax=Oikopleura dioica TaxID=34765 RepID=A0ABN7RX46_OIKDI|nr:Oidioi.mRNA.OKI2018_I69.PAR.g10885.t1.cds [Oikopleura dioica]
MVESLVKSFALGTSATVAAVAFLGYAIYQNRRVCHLRAALALKKYRDAHLKKPFEIETLFFPDKRIICWNLLFSKCRDDSCSYCHDRDAPLARLVRTIQNAKRTIDLALFEITSEELTQAILDKLKEGVRVRLIIDSEYMMTTGSKLGKITSAGCEFIHDHTHGLFHHKFAIIDSQLVISGSMNWTRQAAIGNYENVLLIKDKNTASEFETEYEKMWKEITQRLKSATEKLPDQAGDCKLDPLSAGILSEIEQVKQAYTREKWNKLSTKQQEDIIDGHFVPENVRRMYRKNSRARSPPTEGIYPQRQITTGQGFYGKKNNIQDGFSAPFHWETQSQINEFYILDDDQQTSAKPSLIKSAKDNSDFMGKINAQLETAASTKGFVQETKSATSTPSSSRPKKLAPPPPSRETPPSSAKSSNKPSTTSPPRRAKPPPPPRAPSTRRISDVSEISSSLTPSTPTPPPSRLDFNNNVPTIKDKPKAPLPEVKEITRQQKEESPSSIPKQEDSEPESQNFSDTEELIKTKKEEYNFLLNW